MKDEIQSSSTQSNGNYLPDKAAVVEEKIHARDNEQASEGKQGIYPAVGRVLVIPFRWIRNDWNRATLRKIEPKGRWELFFLLMAVLVAAYTCRVFILQLQEMKSGSADTHMLATAAEDQASADKSLAEQAKAQNGTMAKSLGDTDALVKQAAAQARYTEELAREARKSADIANLS